MSLYDDVRDFIAPCPKCGHELKYWQTKDTEDPYLNTVSFKTVDNFYTICNCGAFVSVNFKKKPPEERTEADYTVKVIK